MWEATVLQYTLVGVTGTFTCLVIFWLMRQLYPKPYPGIPYNKHSAKRISGDIPDLIPVIRAKNQFSECLFDITTQKLGTPIAQVLFPGFRRPLITLEDPREIEDILVRRNKEFDKAPMSIDILSPMFPYGELAQYTTPELRAQKREWADAMRPDFLRKTVAQGIYESASDLVELWRLKASTTCRDRPFKVNDDFENAALDAIWVALVNERLELVRFEMTKLQGQVSGSEVIENERAALGYSLKEEVRYISSTLPTASNSPSPKWRQKLESWTPRYRKCRRTVSAVVNGALEKPMDRFQRLEKGHLETENLDNCMVDLVIRRRILNAKRRGQAMRNPAKDPRFLDQVLVFLVGGYDSTSGALTWFVKFMEAYPAAQSDLRSALKAALPGSLSADKILETDIPYLDAVCEEALRLGGAVKASLRQAIVDTEILGYRIPKGAEIIVNMHIDRPPAPVDESKRSASSQAAVVKQGDGLQGIAGRDLGSFDPRRWLVKDERTGKESFNAYALPCIAFGGGYRGCTGRRLATMEFRIMVVVLIMNFEFLALPEEFRSMKASEQTFRQADAPYARIRAL